MFYNTHYVLLPILTLDAIGSQHITLFKITCWFVLHAVLPHLCLAVLLQDCVSLQDSLKDEYSTRNCSTKDCLSHPPRAHCSWFRSQFSTRRISEVFETFTSVCRKSRLSFSYYKPCHPRAAERVVSEAMKWVTWMWGDTAIPFPSIKWLFRIRRLSCTVY